MLIWGTYLPWVKNEDVNDAHAENVKIWSQFHFSFSHYPAPPFLFFIFWIGWWGWGMVGGGSTAVSCFALLVFWLCFGFGPARNTFVPVSQHKICLFFPQRKIILSPSRYSLFCLFFSHAQGQEWVSTWLVGVWLWVLRWSFYLNGRGEKGYRNRNRYRKRKSIESDRSVFDDITTVGGGHKSIWDRLHLGPDKISLCFKGFLKSFPKKPRYNVLLALGFKSNHH